MDNELFADFIRRGEIPPQAPNCVMWGTESLERHNLRSLCTENGMWAIVDMEWTARLAEWIGDRQVLEIMAGKGWLAKALALQAVKINATDSKEWHKGREEIFPVKKLSATTAVNRYGEKSQVLLVSWPPYGDKAILEALALWGTGKPIIYIGEGQGGCTGCDEFHDNFHPNRKIEIPLPQWPGIHDRVRIGYYRPAQAGGKSDE